MSASHTTDTATTVGNTANGGSTSTSVEAAVVVEALDLTPDQQIVYDAATHVLHTEPLQFLALIPKIVSVEGTIPVDDHDIVTLITPSRGHHELFRALEGLEGLEKEEQSLSLKTTTLTFRLTALVTTGHTHDRPDDALISAEAALASLELLGQSVPRRVCQHPFKKNDIVWVCRTCQADETCVLCHACYSQSNHAGHDVAFYHAQAGGCCDCGDPDAWDPAGFCPRHGPDAATSGGTASNGLPSDLVNRVRGVVPSCVDWLVQTVAANAETGYARANPPPPSRRPRRTMADLRANIATTTTTANTTAWTTPLRQSLPEMLSDAMELVEEDGDDEEEEDSILEESFPLNHPIYRAQVFSPTAASSSSSTLSQEQQQEVARTAEALGEIGRAGHGLFLVLHADDIHSTKQLLDALKDFLGTANYYTDTLLGKLIRALKQYGQLVIWGTMELVQECGATPVHLWMDGDKVATARMGAVILERAGRLTRHGLFCSILTRDELIVEQRAVAVAQWLAAVARSCDPLCLTVAQCILPNRHLVPLLRADFKMSARVTKAWYSLLLTLLAVPTFKSHLAAAYCDTYRVVTAKYARGMGVLERSGYTLSVQFLNRVMYVIDLVQGRDLLGKLGKSLLETLMVAKKSQKSNCRLDPNHFVLTHRRYSPCISDFKCVLNVNGMPRVIAARGGTFLADWISTLCLAQFMDVQVWRHGAQGHVEDESRGWVGAFNASISLGSLFERLLGWADDETSPITEGPLSRDLMSCMDLTIHILTNGIEKWQRLERTTFESTLAVKTVGHTPASLALKTVGHAPSSLPYSTLATKHGSGLAMRHMPISQVSPFSFHLPLHRFVAGCLRELCLRRHSESGGIANLLQQLQGQLSEGKLDDLFQGLMEFPVLVLSRAAQVRAGLWRRNGTGLNDQVLNYAEPPFCRNMRDADLLMTQFATAGRTRYQSPTLRPTSDVGMSFLVNLMLHRLGIFDFVGLIKAPELDVIRYSQETVMGLYPVEKRCNPQIGMGGAVTAPLPWVFSPPCDAATSMLLLEEFFHFIIIFITELPPVVPKNKEEQTNQAKLRLFREVVHRLASGPKTHSELSEVHHVLSHWDNVLLSEEGKLVNPDDATGAALATVLADVADRKVSRGKMEPDKWEMRLTAWESYDPAFFHISLRNHQTATTEGRPKPSVNANALFTWNAHSFAPVPVDVHPFFARLRRDATSDSVVLAIAYRVLHMHLRLNTISVESNLQRSPLESSEKSELALARTIHLLTLGAYSWMNASPDVADWRTHGGGSIGSVFYDRDACSAPTVRCWINKTLLAEPNKLLDSDTYKDEERALILLKRLAVRDQSSGGFVAQDSAVRSGAAWLCEFALQHCPEAGAFIAPEKKLAPSGTVIKNETSDIELRRKIAKEKAIANMKAQAAKFAAMMEVDLGSEEDSIAPSTQDMLSVPGTPSTPNRPMRKASFGSAHSSASSYAVGDFEGGVPPKFVALDDTEDSYIPPRLLQSRPRCIICNDEDGGENRLCDSTSNDESEGQRKKSRRRTENALGFVGYAQASTVLKGGGGPPPDLDSKFSAVCEFVGTHVALCGHAVHSECCESYLATVSHREDRNIGKRDEFRCPLCQRLSNCLIPFIDVGVDWIEPPVSHRPDEVDATPSNSKVNERMQIDPPSTQSSWNPLSLHKFLECTPWWVTRRERNVVWDGQSAFIERMTAQSGDDDGVATRRPTRIRSLKKKDLYAAWNAMMHTPRFVRRKLRRSSSRLSSSDKDATTSLITTGEDSSGETFVWRRFMDQISEISFKADSKRLGDDHLHDLFGEFRHYVVEKHAYSLANRFAGNDPTDWPACVFVDVLSENRKQEMSREKLLSKLLLSIQAFTYSCCSEAFEARRSYRRCLASSSAVAKKIFESSEVAVLSKFGISGLSCDGKMIVMPHASSQEDGSQPFDGRLGKLRYFAITVMAAAGAVAADLVHLVLTFPLLPKESDVQNMDVDNPERAPIAYPVLFGNILTHVVAAMCATCGRARARSDSLDVAWSIPYSSHGGFSLPDTVRGTNPVDSVIEDCEGFIKLGVLARVLQVLVGSLNVNPKCIGNSGLWISSLHQTAGTAMVNQSAEQKWVQCCIKLLAFAVSQQCADDSNSTLETPSLCRLHESCVIAASAATTFLMDAGTIFQILVPGCVVKFEQESDPLYTDSSTSSPVTSLARALDFFRFEQIEEMLQSSLVQSVVSNWFNVACRHEKAASGPNETVTSLRSRLYRTQGFRVNDWPSAGFVDSSDSKREAGSDTGKDLKVHTSDHQPQDDTPSSTDVQIDHMQTDASTTTDVVRSYASPSLLTFMSKKSVSLLGGFSPEIWHSKNSGSMNANPRPRVSAIPTSYTDLYADLASLMPDCEQTAVCLICGEVLNAGGRSECTRHAYKCGAGAGLFFLLQECSGLILHKNKAAYIHSPYVDSHGETPQYRGRPLNLDLDRYEHLREVWFSHGVRQKVMAERGISRQVILPDFY